MRNRNVRIMKALNQKPNLNQYLNQSLNPKQNLNLNPKQNLNLNLIVVEKMVVEEDIVEVVVEEMVEVVEVTKEILEVVDRGGGGRDQGDFGDP